MTTILKNLVFQAQIPPCCINPEFVVTGSAAQGITVYQEGAYDPLSNSIPIRIEIDDTVFDGTYQITITVTGCGTSITNTLTLVYTAGPECEFPVRFIANNTPAVYQYPFPDGWYDNDTVLTYSINTSAWEPCCGMLDLNNTTISITPFNNLLYVVLTQSTSPLAVQVTVKVQNGNALNAALTQNTDITIEISPVFLSDCTPVSSPVETIFTLAKQIVPCIMPNLILTTP